MAKKRIEIDEEIPGGRIRASRTGGVNLSTSPIKGFTLNTEHGARVSKTYNGLTLGFQNFRSVVRGRWNSGGMNVNLSKSGLSLSHKNSLGTFNFTRPRLSSTTIAGIQFRGETGAIVSFIGMLISLLTLAIGALFFLVPRAALFALWFLQLLWNLVLLVGSLLVYGVIDLPKQLFSKHELDNPKSE